MVRNYTMYGLRRRSAAARWLEFWFRKCQVSCLSVSCERCVFRGRLSATSRSRAQRSPTECVSVCVCVWVCVSLSVIRGKEKPLHLQWRGRRSKTEKERSAVNEVYEGNTQTSKKEIHASRSTKKSIGISWPVVNRTERNNLVFLATRLISRWATSLTSWKYTQ